MQMIWHDYILINLNIEAMLEFLNLCFADTPKWAEQSPAPYQFCIKSDGADKYRA